MASLCCVSRVARVAVPAATRRSIRSVRASASSSSSPGLASTCSQGFLVTAAKESQKHGAAEEVSFLLDSAFDKYVGKGPFAELKVCDTPGSKGTVFISMSDKAKITPSKLSHLLFHDAVEAAEKHAHVEGSGEKQRPSVVGKVRRVLPVDAMGNDDASFLSDVVAPRIHAAFPNEDELAKKQVTFAVRYEEHSPGKPRTHEEAEALCRAVADMVPSGYQVHLSEHSPADKTVLIVNVGSDTLTFAICSPLEVRRHWNLHETHLTDQDVAAEFGVSLETAS